MSETLSVFISSCPNSYFIKGPDSSKGEKQTFTTHFYLIFLFYLMMPLKTVVKLLTDQG